MSTITQCPACGTRFKVSQEQLAAYEGMVRCGRCQTAFNARDQLGDSETSPQLDLPIMQEETHETAQPAELPAPEIAPDCSSPNIEPHADSLDFSGAHAMPFGLPETQDVAIENSADAGVVPPTETEEFLVGKSKEKRPVWPWAVASVMLLVLLALQAAYFFRVDLAARLPGLKPALISYCSLLQCSISLPHDADLMSIESSDLEADQVHANLITLTATLRNRAPYAQAYPNLELTLNDINDKPVARRTFHPTEYLLHKEDEKVGLDGRRELNIRLSLDTADLKPSGYRLLLYYK